MLEENKINFHIEFRHFFTFIIFFSLILFNFVWLDDSWDFFKRVEVVNFKSGEDYFVKYVT